MTDAGRLIGAAWCIAPTLRWSPLGPWRIPRRLDTLACSCVEFVFAALEAAGLWSPEKLDTHYSATWPLRHNHCRWVVAFEKPLTAGSRLAAVAPARPGDVITFRRRGLEGLHHATILAVDGQLLGLDRGGLTVMDGWPDFELVLRGDPCGVPSTASVLPLETLVAWRPRGSRRMTARLEQVT